MSGMGVTRFSRAQALDRYTYVQRFACPKVHMPSKSVPQVMGAARSRSIPSGPETSRFASVVARAATLQDNPLEPKMMCYQCEQTAHGTGCVTIGNCGKTPEVAGLQDLLVFSLKGLGTLAHYARTKADITDHEVDSFCLRALFSTLTNVNFDDERFEVYIAESVRLQTKLASMLLSRAIPLPSHGPSLDPESKTLWFDQFALHPLTWNAHIAAVGVPQLTELMAISKFCGILGRQEVLGETVAGLQELCVYGLKGIAAYAAHAEALGVQDPEIYGSVQASLAFLASAEAGDAGNLLEHALHLGSVNFHVMQALSEAHCSTFGSPTPTEVTLVPRPGKCILVTGHDMHDLHELLKQTEGKGVDVYTHGEMLPAHGYPGLKRFPHLAGHYGGAWYQQKLDFAHFPGAVLVTTNCVIEPLNMYRKNLFTTNETGLSNVAHVPGKDFSPVLDRALALPGWTESDVARFGSSAKSPSKDQHISASTLTERKKKVTVGFGHHAVLGVADQVIDALKTGKLSHIFLVGGCDGHEPQRAYYARLGETMPKDTLLLTLGCGKFRLFDQEFGTLPGTSLPRLLDMGQCNDAYSALVVATELAKAFNTDINSLPLSLDISWFEQKAVAVLLTLLHLGVKNIRLGPALPAFLTADAVNILVEKFALKPADTKNPEQDLMAMMRNK